VAEPGQVSAWRTKARGVGSWGPSGVASDGARVFLATGNTFDATSWAGGEAVLSFPSGLAPGSAPADWFVPADWAALDAADLDLGGSGPVLLDLEGATPMALAVALGKDGKLYLLDRNHLGGKGGALSVKEVSKGPIINATAAYTTSSGSYVVFRGTGVGCPTGGGRSHRRAAPPRLFAPRRGGLVREGAGARFPPRHHHRGEIGGDGLGGRGRGR